MSLLAKAERCLLNQVHSGSRVNAFIPSKKRGIIKDLEDANARREEGRHVSNLDGSLMAIKDNICTEQYATSCGSEILKAFTSPYDATVVTKLRAAGAIIAGKTNLDEFGMGSHSTHSCFGPVRNFVKGVKNDISAGGSSGGSAIAVATGQCNAALGTDTGGSVRLPAAYCGIVGFKPSYGLVSRWGVVAYANSLDTVGVLANDSHDAKKVFDTINDYDVRDPTSLSQTSRSRLAALLSRRERQRPLRIGVPVEYNIQELSAMVRDAWLCTIHHLQRLGHSVHQVSLPATKHALSAYYVLAPAEASSNLAKYDGVRYGIRNDDKDGIGGVLYANTRGKGFGDEVKRRILLGAYSLSAEAIDNYFLKAQKVRRLVQQDFNDVFAMPNPLLDVPDAHSELEGVDVLISPTAPTLPPTFKSLQDQNSLDGYMNDVLTVPASLAGLPAISVPIHMGFDGNDEQGYEYEDDDNIALYSHAVGIQITAQYGDDNTVFDVAQMIEGCRFRRDATTCQIGGRETCQDRRMTS